MKEVFMGKSKVDYKQKTEELFATKLTLKNPEDFYEIRNQIVVLNMPLVTTVLKKYVPYTEDQFQIGCEGLIKAADTFDPTRKVPFSSYACFVIEREIIADYKERVSTFEEAAKNKITSLNAIMKFDNGDEAEVGSMIADEEAAEFMNKFVEQNMLSEFCDNILKPAIKEISMKGQKAQSKIDFPVWEQLEFRYFMSLIFEESQKRRFNLTKMASECGVSVPNIRNRHERVLEVVFRRMWNYMTLTFSELLSRIRGSHRIPHRLLCLDPGKTTGWCVFEDGRLTKWGQVENCFDDKNISIDGMMKLFKEVDPDYVVYEDYKVYSNKLDRHAFSPVMTVRLIGMIETYCQLENIPTHKQMATTAKTFCTDEKLQQWGFWQQGMRHARDAIRHGCYFLLFFLKDRDIL